MKHFALNNDEEFRHQVNVKVDERALREIYLPAFKAAVTEGGAWSIMGAYNLYMDQHNCHNPILLNSILKEEWGFDGTVISDWGGTHDTDQAVRNGLDLEFGTWTDGLTMGATNAYDNYYMAEAYKKKILAGEYGTDELDEKVRRVLRLHFRTTMNRNRPYGFLCSEDHYAVALKIAQEGIVLLKNDSGVLPLKGRKKILVVGENAIKMMTVGGGSSSLKAQKEILPLDGIRTRFRDCEVDYARGYVGDTVQSYNGVSVGRSLYETRSTEDLLKEVVLKASNSDVVIFVGGLNKSDYQDCEGHDRKQYGLPYGQDRLVEAILEVNRNLVFVNISGNAVAMPWIDRVPAILQSWYLGSETGTALASVIAGDVNPSGKLPFTWYRRLEDCGAHATGSYPGVFRENSNIIDEEYSEGIFVGYRWTDKEGIAPLFPFGHGLSYTTFRVGKIRCSKKTMGKGGEVSIDVTVTNTGKMKGSETLQLYIRDIESSLERPEKELKGFSKVTLAPGESQVIHFSIGEDALRFYDDRIGEMVAEKGEFEALIGTSSNDILGKVGFEYE